MVFKTTRIGIRRVLLFCLLLVLAAGGAAAACRDDTVYLRGDWGTARFTVEIADEPHEQSQGLMHRKKLPFSAGMLFIYPKPQMTSFWMRNTLIPLDMLFLSNTGVVTHIHHEAIPRDETPIPGGTDVLAVLEINGGLARRLGITNGSEMQHSAFAKYDPNWPCDD